MANAQLVDGNDIPLGTSTNPMVVNPGASNPAAIKAGQSVIAVTGTAVQLGSNALVNGLVLKSKSTNNAAGLFVGPSGVLTTDTGAGNGFKLLPGESISYGANNTNAVYFNGTAGDVVYWTGN